MVSGRDEAPLPEPTPADLLALDIDLRLGPEVWVAASECDGWDEGECGALVRFAYGRGYHDALTERDRAKLCRDHGDEWTPVAKARCWDLPADASPEIIERNRKVEAVKAQRT